jgi:hypothetical protein
MHGSRAPLVHIKMAQYIYIILTVYPVEVIHKVGAEVMNAYLS